MSVDRSVLADRLQKVADLLHADGLGALVMFAHGSALGPSTRSHGHMRFLFDWDGHHSPSIIVLARGRAPVLITPNLFLSYLAQRHHWIADVRFVPLAQFPLAVAVALAEAGVRDGRVALAGREEMPAALWESMAVGLPAVEWTDFTARLDALRVIKDAHQLALHQRGARICDAMFERLARELRTPRPAFQYQADMEHEARYAGAEYVLTWLTIGPVADYSRYFREECQRIPQEGDQVLAGVTLLFEGHWAHAIRMGSRGEPTVAQRKVYAVALEMQEAMLAGLTPGADLHRVQPAAEAVLRAHYPDADRRPVFRFRHGHGLGHSYEDPVASRPFRQIYESATAVPDAPMPVRPGMLFELHPNLFVPDEAGACIGDMVVIEETGPRLMLAFPRTLARW
jgi:Xaa-Pro dipeptidase